MLPLAWDFTRLVLDWGRFREQMPGAISQKGVDVANLDSGPGFMKIQHTVLLGRIPN